MRRLTYRVKNDDKILVLEEHLEEDRVYYSRNLDHEPNVHEIRNKYDEDGFLIASVTSDDGVESSEQVFTYNQHGGVATMQLLVDGVVFEEIKHEKTDTCEIQTYYMDGEQQRKSIFEPRGDGYISYEYEGAEEELVEKFVQHSDSDSDSSIGKTFDGQGQLLSTETTTYNEDSNLLSVEVFAPDGMVIERTKFAYAGDVRILERTENFENGEISETKYNADGELVSSYLWDADGTTLQLEECDYNEDGFIIEQKTLFKFSSDDGLSVDEITEEYLVMEYEDLLKVVE